MEKTDREKTHNEIIDTVDEMVLAMLKARKETGDDLSAAMLSELTKRYGTRTPTGNIFIDGEGDIGLAGVVGDAAEG